MPSKIHTNLARQIQAYMQFMGKAQAVAKVKRNNLGRLDMYVDEAAKLVPDTDANFQMRTQVRESDGRVAWSSMVAGA